MRMEQPLSRERFTPTSVAGQLATMQFPARAGFILVVLGSLGCVHTVQVQIDALLPRYVSPTPARRVILPLVLVYDPKEFPEEVPLAVPGGFPGQPTVRGARSLVT